MDIELAQALEEIAKLQVENTELKKKSIVWHKLTYDDDLPKKEGKFLFRDFKENEYFNYGITNNKDNLKYFDEWAELPKFSE